MDITTKIDWTGLLSPDNLAPRDACGRAGGGGEFPLVFSIAAFIGRTTKRRLSLQGNMLARKGFFYAGSAVPAAGDSVQARRPSAPPCWGTAGIAGIAIGFASQTSVSNIISGIFLISERPFSVGDQIQVGTTKGIILSIDLLSVKLRTFENQLIRIPNESLIKSGVSQHHLLPDPPAGHSRQRRLQGKR